MGTVRDKGKLDSAQKRRLIAFIDEYYVNPDFESAPARFMAQDAMLSGASAPKPSSSRSVTGKLSGLFKRVPRESAPSSQSGSSTVLEEERCAFSAEPLGRYPASPLEAPCEKTGDLAAWLDQVDEPFSTTLLALIDRKGLSDVDVYKRAHMSRQLFSRIRSDADYRPAKKTVLALAIALELSLAETRDLLERAGFALSRSNKRDVIVEYFVTNGLYDLLAVNEALYEFDQPLL